MDRHSDGRTSDIHCTDPWSEGDTVSTHTDRHSMDIYRMERYRVTAIYNERTVGIADLGHNDGPDDLREEYGESDKSDRGSVEIVNVLHPKR